MRITDERSEIMKDIGEVKPKTIFTLGKALGLKDQDIYDIAREMRLRTDDAKEAIKKVSDPLVPEEYKKRFIENFDRRVHGQYGTLDRYWQHIVSRDTGRGGGAVRGA